MMFELKRAAFIAFLLSSILVAMFAGGEDGMERFSAIYFITVLPVLVLPFLWWRQMMGAAVGVGWPLSMLFVTAGGWHLAAGNLNAVIQLFIFVWGLLWVCALDVRISTRAYLILFAFTVAVGVISVLTLNDNVWGVLPGETSPKYSVWRVSFFPNVVLTGFFSLFACIAISQNASAFLARLGANLLAFYFLIFSFVRTAIVAGLLYAPLAAWFALRRPGWKVMFAVPLMLAVAIHASILMLPHLLIVLQENEIVSRLFLRGQSGLAEYEIYTQLFRPWIWQKHFEIFTSSPFLMGAGEFDFAMIAASSLAEDHAAVSGSEALLTRLLATYGLPALLLLWFMGRRLWEHARQGDYVGCAIFPPFIFIAMNYGSILHPSSFLFVLYFLLLVKGRKTFSEYGENLQDGTLRVRGHEASE